MSSGASVRNWAQEVNSPTQQHQTATPVHRSIFGLWNRGASTPGRGAPECIEPSHHPESPGHSSLHTSLRTPVSQHPPHLSDHTSTCVTLPSNHSCHLQPIKHQLTFQHFCCILCLSLVKLLQKYQYGVDTLDNHNPSPGSIAFLNTWLFFSLFFTYCRVSASQKSAVLKGVLLFNQVMTLKNRGSELSNVLFFFVRVRNDKKKSIF